MKVALCLSGQPDLFLSAPYILENMCAGYDVDVFFILV